MIVTRDKDSHYAEDHRPPQYQTTSSNTSTLTVVYIDIVSVFLLLSPHILPGASRGFAFVEFSTEEEATRWMNHKQVQETKESITMSISSSYSIGQRKRFIQRKCIKDPTDTGQTQYPSTQPLERRITSTIIATAAAAESYLVFIGIQ